MRVSDQRSFEGTLKVYFEIFRIVLTTLSSENSVTLLTHVVSFSNQLDNTTLKNQIDPDTFG